MVKQICFYDVKIEKGFQFRYTLSIVINIILAYPRVSNV